MTEDFCRAIIRSESIDPVSNRVHLNDPKRATFIVALLSYFMVYCIQYDYIDPIAFAMYRIDLGESPGRPPWK